MAKPRLLCRLIGHAWKEGRGAEGERFLRCKRCGAIGSHPNPPVGYGM